MFSKIILGLVLTTASVSSIYCADLDSGMTPDITNKIADAISASKSIPSVTLNGKEWNVVKLDDPTAPLYHLSDSVRSDVDAAITKTLEGAKTAPGNYTILVRYTISDRHVFRIIKFEVKSDPSNPVQEVKELALVEFITTAKPSSPVVVSAAPTEAAPSVEHRAHAVVERAHSAPALVVEERAHAVVERVHMSEHIHAVAENTHSAPSAGLTHSAPIAASAPTSGLAAPDASGIFNDITSLFNDARVHSDGARVHDVSRVHSTKRTHK